MKSVYHLILGIILVTLLPQFLQAQLSPITDIKLIFTSSNGEVSETSATDLDGNGLVISGSIDLLESRAYTLAIEISNSGQSTDINEEITADATRYQIFFATTDHSLIRDIEYNDSDSEGLPIGLVSTLVTDCHEDMDDGDSLQIVLSDLMETKSDTSNIMDGTSLFDLTWTVNVNEDPDAPPCENEEEIITDVILTWTPIGSGDPIIARAQDPDGEGPQDIQILDDIELFESTQYSLALELRNEIAGEDITEEIMQEDDEHLFFFAFSEGVFSNPSGDGNIDIRGDDVNYNDFDENNLPVGLSTTWTTAMEMASGEFQIILKHQPDVKSETSTVNDGGTDLDLTWTINTVVTSSHDFHDEHQAHLVVSPNPVQEILNWQFESDLDFSDNEIMIFDATGQLHYHNRSNASQIDVSGIAPGFYIFQWRSGPNVVSKRFIKTD